MWDQGKARWVLQVRGWEALGIRELSVPTPIICYRDVRAKPWDQSFSGSP